MEDVENAMVLLYDMCRLCLDEPGVINIFKPVDWSQNILTYTGLEVTTTDKYPQTICRRCWDIMSSVKTLKDIATANDERLRNIRGSDVDPVFRTDSSSHLVIITPSTSCDYQIEHTEVTELFSQSTECFERIIVFESEDETTKTFDQNEKQNRKKRKSSNLDNISNASKIVTVRKDLFAECADYSTTVTSTTKRRKETLTSSTSLTKEPDTDKTSTTKKIEQSPTSTSDKTVTVGEIKIKSQEFKCETCNKSYETQKKLYFHQLAHNKKFQCPLDACSKKFASKGDLQKHIRSHTGEKPYKCDLCDQSFTQNVSLKLHKEKKHIESHT